ncbi:nitrite reductase/ring-hydroxylating ferredoxin subunit [Sulfuritortus calidifontis]|uniref:Nitrite reductase/ring-hydroxylating ferredoxin subunit n=1 Tax=Sulfuritortus calidifontis TaxID=1914471 RepID=A0A4R3JUH5_9PROT|nr:Rieske 2Fe-2S domain-containing protein [Sulfuritortus calidifontis]TCS71467.1 nitrite reductase/ring-hydroxylating ferredoxin subunit [Sulfuritortus calidifontis]
MAENPRLICAASDLQDGGRGVRFEAQWGGQPTPAFVIRFKGRVYGYLNRCGHIPVELDFQPGEFFDDSRLYLVCATHGALYAPESGACLGGRCERRGLLPLEVIERDGGIYVKE